MGKRGGREGVVGGVKFPRPVDVEASSSMHLDFLAEIGREREMAINERNASPFFGRGGKGERVGGEDRGGGGKWGGGGWVGRRVIE